MDRTLVLAERTRLVAEKITEFLKSTDRMAKTIVFCEDIDHAERMRQALVNANADLAADNARYVVRITGDSPEGKAELDYFIDPESRYPVIATTSKLLSTGVDAQTCQLIVLDQRIESMTEFKQIIGRGTRIREDFMRRWTEAEKKSAVIDALEEHGVLFDALAADVGRDYDAFDLVCHVAFGQSPLTRRERADSVRKRDYFGRYSDRVRAVLEALLDKYADEGVEDIEDMGVLRVRPISQMGTPVEILTAFGGRTAFLEAVRDLEQQLYA